jgi:2-methylcitrate dehydratase PrpD
VTVVEDPAYTAKLPAVRAARVTVHFSDGKFKTAEALGSRGDPHDPLSAKEIKDKFLELAVPEIGHQETEWIIQTVLSIECLEDVTILVSKLSGK